MHQRMNVRHGAGLFTIVLLLLVGAFAPTAMAGAGKTFSTNLVPQSVPGGSTSLITATVKNDSDPQGVGSANLTLPAGWTTTTADTSTTKGMATVVGQVVQLRGLNLGPGQSAVVTMSTKVPCGTGPGIYSAVAKQANDFNGAGNDVALNSASSDLSVDRSGVCRLRFVTQPPPDVRSGQAFPASIEFIDGSGARTPTAAPLTLTATGATIGGTTSATSANGLASFSGVTLTAADQTPATLTASSPGYGSATSTPTTVHGDYVRCDPNVECAGTETYSYSYQGQTLTASLAVRALSAADGTRILIDHFLSQDANAPDDGCAGDDLPNPVYAAFIATNRPLEVRQTIDKLLPRMSNLINDLKYGGPLRACMTLPYAFAGSTAVPPKADGTPQFRGILETCSFLGVLPYQTTPCVTSQGTNADGSRYQVVTLPASPLDPNIR